MPDRRSRSAAPPEACANCGAAIPRDAKACPECGADEKTGWRETDVYDGLDLPDDAYVEDGTQPRRRRKRVNGLAWYWWALAVALLLLIASIPFLRH
jgi:predicted nucleic acid-binding Zn ribbon protein